MVPGNSPSGLVGGSLPGSRGSGAAEDTAVLGLTRSLAHPVCHMQKQVPLFPLSASSACWGEIKPKQPCSIHPAPGAVSSGAADTGTRVLGLGQGRAGGRPPLPAGTSGAGFDIGYKARSALHTQTGHHQNSAAANRIWGPAG